MYLEQNKLININDYFKITNFSSGEWNVRLIKRITTRDVTIKWNWFENKDVMLPIFMANCIKSQYGDTVDINLLMEYAPYSRQDRLFDAGECINFSVLLSVLRPHFQNIIPMCLHNNTYISNQVKCQNIKLDYFVYNLNVILVFPDLSAEKHLDDVHFNRKIVISKQRKDDVIVSVIDDKHTSFDVAMLTDMTQFVIIDDICAGGKTFVNAANLLTEKFGNDIDITLIVNVAFLDFGLDALKKSGIKRIVINSDDSYNAMLRLYPDDLDYFIER